MAEKQRALMTEPFFHCSQSLVALLSSDPPQRNHSIWSEEFEDCQAGSI